MQPAIGGTSTALFPRRSASRARSTGVFKQITLGLCVALVSVGVAVGLLPQGSLRAAAVLIGVAAIVWLVTTPRTELALGFLVLYLGLLDGYAKLSTGKEVVTFVRDGFIFAIVIGLLVRVVVRRQSIALPPLSRWVVAYVALVLLQFANPQAGTLPHSIAGARQHLEFVPLFFLAFNYLRTSKRLRVLFILLGIIVIPNAVTNYVQNHESSAQFASWGPGYAQRVLGEGAFAGGGRTYAGSSGQNGVRPFGLGSDAGDGGLFGTFAICGELALILFARRPRDRLLAVLFAAGSIFAVYTSQDRAAVLATIAGVLVFALLMARSKQALRAIAVLVGGVLVISSVGQAIGTLSSAGNRYAGLASPSSVLKTVSKSRGTSITAIPGVIVAHPLGVGLGTVGPAAVASGGVATSTLTALNGETEISFLTIENGVAGMLALIGLLVAITVVGVRGVRQEPDPEARALLAAIVAPLAALIALSFGAAWTPTVPAGPYFWVAAGVISYWLIELPRSRRASARASSTDGDYGLLQPPLSPPSLRTAGN